MTRPEKITTANGKLHVPDIPIIPFIEGDGTGPDIWRASVRVIDAAVEKAYGGRRRIEWREVYAGQKAFPGDLLLKNFGVTRHGRVAFYDYDELRLLTDCNFRHMPQPRDLDEELAAEPWFYVGDGDIFPEEFITFMGLLGTAREAFLQAHGDLLGPDVWQRVQARILAGEVMDIFPYQRGRRLRLRPAAAGKEHGA